MLTPGFKLIISKAQLLQVVVLCWMSLGLIDFNIFTLGFLNLIVGVLGTLWVWSFFDRESFKSLVFVISIVILLFFYLIHLDYYATYFGTQYIIIVLSFFIGVFIKKYHFEQNFVRLFYIFCVLSCIQYVFDSPFWYQSGNLRLVSIVGGPPKTSFIFALFTVLFYLYRRYWLFSICIVGLILTGNRISFIAVIVALMVDLIRQNSVHWKKMLMFCGVASLLFLAMYFTGLWDRLLVIARVIDSDGNYRLGSLKGRLVHWNWALIHFSSGDLWHKIFGYGINSTKRIFFESHRYNGQYTGSGAMHNEYLRVLVENGIAGVMVLFYWGFRMFKNSKVWGIFNNRLIVTVMLLIIIIPITDNILYSYNSFMLIAMFSLGYASTHSMNLTNVVYDS